MKYLYTFFLVASTTLSLNAILPKTESIFYNDKSQCLATTIFKPKEYEECMERRQAMKQVIQQWQKENKLKNLVEEFKKLRPEEQAIVQNLIATAENQNDSQQEL